MGAMIPGVTFPLLSGVLLNLFPLDCEVEGCPAGVVDLVGGVSVPELEVSIPSIPPGRLPLR